MTDDPKRLLGGYATDSLTEAERQELLRAAVGDQKLFDALVEEEGLRRLLSDPAARQQVLAALQESRPRERWLARLWRPATVGDLLAVAAAVVVAVAASQVYRATKSEHVTPAARPALGALSQEALERLAAVPARTGATAAKLEFEEAPSGVIPQVRPGETLTIRVTAQAPSQAVVLESRPDGKVVQVWPDPRTPPAHLLPSPGNGPAVQRLRLSATSVPGKNRLRLIVAPSGIDLGASPLDIDRVAQQLTLVDAPYETERP